MRKIQLLILIITFSFTSCYNDRDDLEPETVTRNPNDNQFISENGETYSTGLECNGTGNYNVDEENLLKNLTVPVNLPETFDLSDLLPPVENQGQLASCTSWAVSYYMKSFQEKIESGEAYTETNTLSPSYTYNQLTTGTCGGTSINETLALVQEKGVAPIAIFPYMEDDCSTQASEAVNEVAADAKIADYKSLSGENMVAEMKTLITQNQPVIIGAVLSLEFGKTDSFGLSAYREHQVDYNSVTCHAMLVVGFNNEFQAFKVVNSWGKSWGDNGFAWIDYKAFENVLNENADFRVINQAYVAYDL